MSQFSYKKSGFSRFFEKNCIFDSEKVFFGHSISSKMLNRYLHVRLSPIDICKIELQIQDSAQYMTGYGKTRLFSKNLLFNEKCS